MDFNDALNFVLQKEGGYSNDPTDKGGPTNFGISQKAHPNIDVSKLTPQDAAKIYKNEYWDQIGADNMPPEMRLVAFDAAVQHGVPTARLMIENSGGDVNKIVDSRRQLYKTIVDNNPSQGKFSKGWNNRLDSVVKTSGLDTPQTAPADQAKIESYVAQMATQKMGDSYIIQKLTDAGYGQNIKDALAQGYEPSDIVNGFGGQTLEKLRAVRNGVDNQSFITNLGEGVSNAVSDIGNAGKQLGARFTGNDAQLKQLQQQQQQVEQDPHRQAVGETWGSTIGNGAVKALPYIAAGLATDGAVLPLMLGQGAAGAVGGAMTPTTGDGQIIPNILRDSAIGAGTAGFAKGVTKLAGRAISGDADGVINAKINDARAMGLPVSPMTVSDFWRNQAANMPGATSVKNFMTEADNAINKRVAANLGVTDWTGKIDSDLIQAAKTPIKEALDRTTNVPVVLPKSTGYDLGVMELSLRNPLTAGIGDSPILAKAINNLHKAADAGTVLEGKNLQGLASELKDLIANPNSSLSSSQKQLAAKLITHVNDALKNAMTADERVAFDTATNQYAALQAVGRMVRLSNDTGVVTPRQIMQAAKTGHTGSWFQEGHAPFQNLGKTAQTLYGTANGRGLSDIITKAVGSGNQLIGASSIMNPHIGIPVLGAKLAAQTILAKLATTQNPLAVSLLTRSNAGLDPALQNFIAKAISSGAGARATTP